MEISNIEKEIIGEIYTSREVYDNLLTLCDQFGSRFAGTESEKQAVKYILEKFSEYGLEDSHIEEFEYNGWIRGKTEVYITSPINKKIDAIALPYCPSTSDEGLEAEVIDLGHGLPIDYERNKEKIKGKIVLVTSFSPPYFHRWIHRVEKFGRAVEAGAVGFLFMNHYPGLLAPTGSARFNMEAEIPAVGITKEDGELIKRLMRLGKVKVKIKAKHVTKKLKSWNIIGDLPGSERKDELIIIGAHFDGHDISQGAMDDAAGACIVMEVARVLAKYRNKFKRTIRFICFSAEEIGLIGSHAYINKHKHLVKNIKFMINLDGAGRASRPGIMLQGFPELISMLKELVKDMNYPIPIADRLGLYSDYFPFVLEGIPAGTLASGSAFKEARSGRGFGHTKADTVDKLDIRDMQEAAMVVARIAIRLADSSKLKIRQKSKKEIVEMLKKYGYIEILKYEKRPNINIPL
ncbi:MAG: M28 family peptidase [archaeon GB-1845-036]|nr:M28 family peptidase [Candidatus Culexmicrobium thermophilum]